MPKWRYDFNCRKCDNIQFIDDPARGRLGDYCVACVEAFDPVSYTHLTLPTN